MRLSSTNLSCQLSASAKSLKALRRRGGKQAAPTIYTRRIKVADQPADATDQACCREGLQPGSGHLLCNYWASARNQVPGPAPAEEMRYFPCPILTHINGFKEGQADIARQLD